MNVYVESNFVLELALLQEQHVSCEEILQLNETGKIQLVIPAYALAEPYETLVRHHKERKRIKAEIDRELRQLARTTTYAQQLSEFQSLTALLIDSADEETKRLERIRARILKAAEVVPLDASVLATATQYQKIHGLPPQDSIMYVTVLSHLEQAQVSQSCFLNRNARDFDDPDLVDELSTYNCKLLVQFDAGYQFILSHLSQQSKPA